MTTEIAHPILITGSPRSGSTIIAHILRICGVFVSQPLTKMQESEAFNNLIKLHLLKYGVDPRGQFPLAPLEDQEIIIPGFKESIQNLIMAHGYHKGPWVIKSSSIALMWHAWKEAFPNAKFIIVRRSTDSIIDSCIKTGYMDAFPEKILQLGVTTEKEAWEWMVQSYISRFDDMIMEGLDVKVIWPERMARGDYSQVFELVDWLELPWQSEILAHIDPKFWKFRKRNKS